MNTVSSKSSIVPFSLKNAPSLIERIWPAQKISVEAQKERKAVQSQTLVGLASYWKGRKPLSLVRACVLGALLPATGNAERDLEIFELLMGMDDDQLADRFQSVLTVADIRKFGSLAQCNALLDEDLSDDKPVYRLKKLPKEIRTKLMAAVIARMPYQERVSCIKRAEEIDEIVLTGTRMSRVNAHLGTSAKSLAELVEQLGIARYGHRPTIGDTFAGGGSIPFEASRLGCNVVASDLNPVACMLTWGAIEFLSSDTAFMSRFEKERRRVIDAVGKRLAKYECNKVGDRARIYLYCVEILHHSTGWRIPVSPSWILHEGTRTILTLKPNRKLKRFDFEVIVGASAADYNKAAEGNLKKGYVTFSNGDSEQRISISDIRSDVSRTHDQKSENALRRWSASDVAPRPDDTFGERLCAVRWTAAKTGREYFTVPNTFDEAIEDELNTIVHSSLSKWQRDGSVPDMAIEPGQKTDEPIRTRGWTYWHHLFNPRQLFMFATLMEQCATIKDERIRAGMYFIVGKALNRGSRLSRWQPHRATSGDVFYNQALNTLYNYGCRAFSYFDNIFEEEFAGRYLRIGTSVIDGLPASSATQNADIFITDPPYADAVNYHEITEFFIAWFRKKPPRPFADWKWDSRRPLAIKGQGDEFKKGMVDAYKTMAERMPENGLQIVMFTHQDAGVWADMAQIFWGSSLQVMAAWYIATETTSELKKGGYVQGTVILVLRKRQSSEDGYKDEIVQEVKFEVANQIDTMSGLNQSLRGHGRIENLFEDADLQMAGYAAALRVLTRYSSIDGIDMTKEALRPRTKGDKSLVGDIIEFAVQVANEHMVPEGMVPQVWEKLSGSERFYFKMMDIETTGAKKLDNYQNFAKAFRVARYDDLMGSIEPNKARLKSAAAFQRSGFEGGEFGGSKARALLFAIYELQKDVDGDDVLSHLRDLVPDYFNAREDLAALSDYVAKKRANVDAQEARAAGILHGLIRNERFG